MNVYSKAGYRLESTRSLSDTQLSEVLALVRQPQQRMKAELSGRAKVTFGALSEIGVVVVKGYHRGGLLRRLLPSVFPRWRETRAQQEARFLRYVSEHGVRVPEALVSVSRGTLFYRGWLVLSEIEGHRTLVELSRESDVELADLVAELARMVRTLIQLQVFHLDLHPGNVLVDGKGEVFLIDFDKAYFFRGSRENLQELYVRRWRRAVIKHSLPDALSELFCGGVLRNFPPDPERAT